MKPLRSPLFDGLLAAALFGASTPAAKHLLSAVSPLTLAGLLYLGAALATLPWARQRQAPITRAGRRNLLLLGGSVLFGGVLGPALLLLGLAQAPAASVALWLNLESVGTVLLAWAVFREHVRARTWLAALLVFAASVLLAAPSGLGLRTAGLLVGLACLCWAVDNNLTALIDRLTPAQTTFAKGLVAGTVNLGLGLSLERHWPGLAATFGAVLVGALSYGLSLVLYIGAAQQLGAARSQLAFATAPLWGVLLAWSVLLESPTMVQGLAMGAMLVALWLMHSERHGHAHVHDAKVHTHRHRHDDGHHDHHHQRPGLPAWAWHTHEHAHAGVAHTHAHRPDLHHRHAH